MLHTIIRSSHHLASLLKEEATLNRIYVFQGPSNLISVDVFKITRKNGKTDVFVIQSYKRSHDLNPSSYDSEKVEKVFNVCSENTLMSYKKFLDLINASGCLIFVDDIEERLETFISSNKKIILPVITKIGCRHEPLTKFLYSLSNESPNLFAWAIKCFYRENWRLNVIQHVLYFASQYSTIASKLSKGTVTAYRDWYELRHEIHKLIMNKKANDAINQFNTKQKKLLKQMELTDDKVVLFNKFQRLSNTKRVNFIQKMSTIEDVEDIIKQLETLTNKHFEWSYASLKSFVETNEYVKSHTVYDNGSDFIVFKLDTYESVKYLAKSTNWCIAKNKKYWNQYVGSNKSNPTIQFILFDFTKKEDDDLSIVGITIDTNGYITAAHSFTNHNLLGDREYRDGNAEFLHVEPFIIKIKDIYSLLSAKHLTVDMLLGRSCPSNTLSEWNQKAFMSWIGQYFMPEDINIHYNNNGILLISIPTTEANQDKMRRMFGRGTFSMMTGNLVIPAMKVQESGRMLYLCDFTKPMHYRGKSYITFTHEDTRDHVETNAGCVFNSVYETMGDVPLKTLLGAFNIPLDNIKIPTDDITIWESCLTCCDFTTMEKLLENKNFIHVVRNTKYGCDKLMKHMIVKTLFHAQSLDLINFIYGHGYKLSDFMSNREDILSILLKLHSGATSSRKCRRRPSNSAYESILNHTWQGDSADAESIVHYHTFLRIIENERDNAPLFKYIMWRFDYFTQTMPPSQLTFELINFILDNYDITSCVDKNTIDNFLTSIRRYIMEDSEIAKKVKTALHSTELIEKYVTIPCGF